MRVFPCCSLYVKVPSSSTQLAWLRKLHHHLFVKTKGFYKKGSIHSISQFKDIPLKHITTIDKPHTITTITNYLSLVVPVAISNMATVLVVSLSTTASRRPILCILDMWTTSLMKATVDLPELMVWFMLPCHSYFLMMFCWPLYKYMHDVQNTTHNNKKKNHVSITTTQCALLWEGWMENLFWWNCFHK